MSVNALIDVRLESIRFGSRDINLYELRRCDGSALPDFTPGAHIDLHLPNGIVRQYSLVEWGSNPSAYFIGVKHDPASRGGSKYLHEVIRVSALLKISAPRTNFLLDESAEHSVLFAGGIGVTPIFTMWKRLRTIGRSYKMYYSTRSRSDAVFFETLRVDPNVTFHFDDENSESFIDIPGILNRSSKDTHLYCCGPVAMLKGFEAAAAEWPADHVHLEYFSTASEPATTGGFVVELAHSGLTFHVEPGQTILTALRAAGADAPSSCEEGICGACITDVISGVPDHRDSVLTAEERRENKKIALCCSSSKSSRLVLDL